LYIYGGRCDFFVNSVLSTTIDRGCAPRYVNLSLHCPLKNGKVFEMAVQETIYDGEYYGPFEIQTAKLAGGTWYNVTRYFVLTSERGLYMLTRYIGNDTDNDGLCDGEEEYSIGSEMDNADMDGDGLQDGTESGMNDTTKHSFGGSLPDQLYL